MSQLLNMCLERPSVHVKCGLFKEMQNESQVIANTNNNNNIHKYIQLQVQ